MIGPFIAAFIARKILKTKLWAVIFTTETVYRGVKQFAEEGDDRGLKPGRSQSALASETAWRHERDGLSAKEREKLAEANREANDPEYRALRNAQREEERLWLLAEQRRWEEKERREDKEKRRQREAKKQVERKREQATRTGNIIAFFVACVILATLFLLTSKHSMTSTQREEPLGVSSNNENLQEKEEIAPSTGAVNSAVESGSSKASTNTGSAQPVELPAPSDTMTPHQGAANIKLGGTSPTRSVATLTPPGRSVPKDSMMGYAPANSGLDDNPLGVAQVRDSYLSEEDLAGLSLRALCISYNGIYALHGCPFKRPTIRHYFSRLFWYKPNPKFSESDLSPTERQNLKTIRTCERNHFGY